MSTILKISKDENGTSVDQHEYRSMIAPFFLTASRPDIAYSVGVCVHDINPIPRSQTRR